MIRNTILFFALFFMVMVSGVYSQKKLIAFSSDATGNDLQQIFIMDEDGDNVRQVAFLNLDCYSPRISPDSKTLVFCATNRISDYLYSVNIHDTSTYRFPAFIDGGLDPVFSADGSMLMYRSEREENNAIYIMDMATGESFPISDGSLATHSEFSHDGTKVIYSSSATQNFDLVLLNLLDTTDNAQQVLAATKDAEIYGTIANDGMQIAFASFDINYKGTVKVCDDKGKNVKVISSSGSSYNPKFSPNSKKLAFISDKSGGFEIYVCNTDGSGMKQVSNEPGNVNEFFWSGDSEKIVFDSQMEGTSSIWIVNVESGSKQNLTGGKANNISPFFQQ